jgi:hypothetical protein
LTSNLYQNALLPFFHGQDPSPKPLALLRSMVYCVRRDEVGLHGSGRASGASFIQSLAFTSGHMMLHSNVPQYAALYSPSRAIDLVMESACIRKLWLVSSESSPFQSTISSYHISSSHFTPLLKQIIVAKSIRCIKSWGKNKKKRKNLHDLLALPHHCLLNFKIQMKKQVQI